MKQISFAQAEYQNKKKVTRHERFLSQMEALVPRQRLIDALSPSYFPNAAGRRGRPPIGLERMLRIYFLQQWYALADEALEDAINAHLAEQGLFMREGTIVDATMTGQLVREDDKRVYGDAGYTGMGKYLDEEKDAPDARSCVAAKRGAIKKMDDSPMKRLLLAIEKTKASIRAKVEHPFHVIKNLFGYRKARYKGLAKNQAQLFSLFGLANLMLATRCDSQVDEISAP